MGARSVTIKEPDPKSVDGLLQKIATDWCPKPIAVQPIADLTWGEVPMPGAESAQVAVHDGKCRLLLTGPTHPVFRGGVMKATATPFNGAPLRGRLADGRLFEAKHGYWTRDAGPRVTLLANDWCVRREEGPPCLWVAGIEGTGSLENEFEGNLCIYTPTSASAGHLRLQGKYSYYVLHRERKEQCPEWWREPVDKYEWFLAIHPEKSPSAVDAGEARIDFLILQVVLGRPLKIENLYGLNEAGEVVAIASGNYGTVQVRTKPEVVVPRLLTADPWVPLFFELLARAWRQRPGVRFYVPLQYYLDSLTDHMEGSYTSLQVALEAFAYEVRTAQTRDPLVADSGRWTDWVASVEDHVRTLAAEGKADKLIRKLKSSTPQPPAGEVVEEAFEQFQIPFTDAMSVEIRGRHKAVHAATMFKGAPAEIDVERQAHRLALLRSMLVALVAKVVGYSGPIVGWERNETRRWGPPPPTWWPPAEAAQTGTLQRFDVGDPLLWRRNISAGGDKATDADPGESG